MRLIERIDLRIHYETQRFIQKHYPPRPGKGGVLVFHEVSDDIENCIAKDYAIKEKEFREFVNMLLKYNMAVETINEYQKEKALILTFDDGYECNMHTAYPYLDSNSIPYTIFVPTDYLNRDGYIDVNTCKELAQKENVTIGGHSKTHVRLNRCNQMQLTEELSQSKNNLELIIGCAVDYMAYPYGSMDAVNRRVIKSAGQAGYHAAFSTICVNSQRFHDPLFWPRITVTSSNYQMILLSLLRGLESDA